MISQVLKRVLDTVRDHIETHEGYEHSHAKSSQHVCAFQTEWMREGATLPDLEIGHDVYSHADSSSRGVEEEES